MREDRRFVSGQATYVSDVTPPGTRHAAVLTSPYACARIVKIDAAEALAMPGVHAVVEGRELAAATDPLLIGVDAPQVKRYPLAVGRARYAGEWVAVVVAETRALAEDAREKIRVEYEELPFVLDAEAAYRPGSVPVHPEHGSNVLLDQRFVWGDVDAAFAAAPHTLTYRVKWGRSATVPIETFGVVASWDPWREMLDVWASIQMPKFADQIARALRVPLNGVRVHQDVDVGGSYGVKRGIKHTVLAGFLSRKLGAPVKLIEDRLENMRGGDMHGPERVFDVELAFDGAGLVQAMRMRAIDNVGAYAGRSPLQLGKPVGAIVGPYRTKAVAYHAIAVTTNKTPQEAVRGFGQAPTNYAIETGIDRIAETLGLDRLEVRRRNFIRADEFPYLIPSGTTYDSGDYHAVVAKTVSHVDWDALLAEREKLRSERASCRHRPRQLPRAQRRQFLVRAAAQSEEHHDDVDGVLPHHGRCARRHHAHHPHHVGRPGPRDAGRHRRRRGARHRPRSHSRGARHLAGKPAEQQPRRQPHGDHAGRRGLSGRAEAARQAPRHCRASVGRAGGAAALPQRRRGGPGDRPRARMDGPGADRAPPLPHAAAGHGARHRRQPHHAGADRRRPADGRRARPDVSLLLLRVPRRAAVDRPGDRQAARSTATSSATTAARSSIPTSCVG